MGALMIVSFVSMILLGLPTITYFYAKQLERNAKAWFVIGFFYLESLPSFFLFYRIYLKKKNLTKKVVKSNQLAVFSLK